MLYSTSDSEALSGGHSIKPITITKATKVYKNCMYHIIQDVRLKTDKFTLPYNYSDKFNKITITMPISNHTIYNDIHANVLEALNTINVDPKNLQLVKNDKMYLQITDRTLFFDKNKQPIDHTQGIEQLKKNTQIRCILTFNAVCDYKTGCSYKVNVDQVQILDRGYTTECEFVDDDDFTTVDSDEDELCSSRNSEAVSWND